MSAWLIIAIFFIGFSCGAALISYLANLAHDELVKIHKKEIAELWRKEVAQMLKSRTD